MSLILGMDIATITGFAFYVPGENLATIRTGTLKFAGNCAEEKAGDMATQLIRLIRADKPDFVAFEAPMRNIVSFKRKRETLAGAVEDSTINPNALQLTGLACAAAAIISAYRIPWISIPSATWRKHFLGRGREKGWQRADWKRAAIERCRMLKINVKSNDAAEAVGIAMAAEASQPFKMLKAKISA